MRSRWPWTLACDEQAGRAYANLYTMYVASLRLAEGEGVYVEGVAYCDEHDISTYATCLRGVPGRSPWRGSAGGTRRRRWRRTCCDRSGPRRSTG